MQKCPTHIKLKPTFVKNYVIAYYNIVKFYCIIKHISCNAADFLLCKVHFPITRNVLDCAFYVTQTVLYNWITA